MNTKYGKLISRDRQGNLTAVYPEILCDDEVNFDNRTSTYPVTNIGVANAIDNAVDTAKNSIQYAFTSKDGGLGWNESTQRGYVDFSKMPSSQIEGIVNSMVDPNGAIVADSSSGKLTVDFSKLTPEQIMALCSTNGGIIASTETGANHGKLAIDFSKMPADQIKAVVKAMVDPNGAIIGDPTSGLLTVDFSKLTVQQVMALCLAGGGIVADQNTGKLKIDFSAIDADTKRNITSSLKMQVPLSASKTVYVDNIAGNDTYLDAGGIIIAGKGESKSTAFKTIQTAVNFVTEQWAMGSKSVTIRLIANASNPYAEYIVTLPPFTRTTGNIHIVSDDRNNRAKVVNKYASGRLFYCNGGSYSLQNLDLEAEYYYTDENIPHYPGLVGVDSYGSVTLYGCHSKCSYRASDPACPKWFSLRLFTTSSFGSISFGLQSGTHNTVEYHKNNASDCIVLHGQSNGKFSFHSASTDETITLDIPVANEDQFNELLSQSYSTVVVSNSTTQGNKRITEKISIVTELMRNLGLGSTWRNYLYGDSMYAFEAWGECTDFCSAASTTLVRYAAGSNYDQFFIVPAGKEATGRRFICGSSSCIEMNVMGNSFPGTTQGRCIAGEFCLSKTNVDGTIASTIFDEGFSYLAKTETATGSKTFGAGLFGNTVAMSANEINLALGTVFTKKITAVTTFTIKGTPDSTAATFNLILTNGGSKTINWPSNVKWTDGTPPDLTSSGVDVLTFLTPDGGTTWYGCLALNGAA